MSILRDLYSYKKKKVKNVALIQEILFFEYIS